MHQQDRVGAAVADIAAGGELGLLFGRQALPAVGADQQPGGALAFGGPVGVVGQRGDAVQLSVDPEAGADHRDREQQQERQHDANNPRTLAARRRLRRGGGRRWRWLAANGLRLPGSAVAAAGVAAAVASAGSVGSVARPVAAIVGSRRITCDGSRGGVADAAGIGARARWPIVVHSKNVRGRRAITVQPAEMAGQQRVADERHGVDHAVRDDQRPQPPGAPPRVAEHQAHRRVAQAGAEALIEVVRAA